MAKRTSVVREFYDFIMERKAYWMIPIVSVLLLLMLLIVLGGTSAAPFIYTLF